MIIYIIYSIYNVYMTGLISNNEDNIASINEVLKSGYDSDPLLFHLPDWYYR